MNAPHLRERVYRVLFPFCGVGGGALGFKRAVAEFRQLGIVARFEIMGGIECDPSTARDFTRLTGAPCLVAKVEELTPERLVEFFGIDCPDVVFFSPPCKPASGLLAAGIAATPKYKAMAMLGSVWVDLMFRTWPRGPRLTIMENVPRVRTRAPEMMAQIRASHRKHGYHITEASHDLGEVGGLGQHRDRLLFVARRKDVSSLLYQPIKRRVRSVGEVIGALPFPGDPAAGSLHRLPKIEAITALRLALIPAGGDWNDLPPAVHLHPDFAALMGKRRAVSNRTPFNDVWRVVKWDEPAPCVTAGGTPSSGGLCIADPRPAAEGRYGNNWRVERFDVAAHVVTGVKDIQAGAPSVADPRMKMGEHARTNILATLGWDDPARTVTGASRPAGGALSVADPRTLKPSHPHTYGVLRYDDPSHTITGNGSPGGGPFSVADARIGRVSADARADDHGVIAWDQPSGVVTGRGSPSNGRFSVADPRITCKTRENSGIYGVLRYGEPSGTIVGHACHDNGRFSVADERAEAYRARCPFPVIIALDGTIHRPLTTAECALLQDFPAQDEDGTPFTLEGGSDACRVKIGDAVPPGAAQRVGEQMLLALVHADEGAFVLSGAGGVWVQPQRHGIEAGHA